jgi:CBS domain-containing protein
MRISELMSQPAVCCGMHDMAHVATRQMWENDIGCVAVVDDDGRVTGIVTDRDICMATYTQGKPPQAISLADIMTKQVFACRPSDTIETADRVMGEKQIRRMPIVDEHNRPVGFLSMNDITRGAASGRTDGVGEREVVQVMAAIGQPRHAQPPSAA